MKKVKQFRYYGNGNTLNDCNVDTFEEDEEGNKTYTEIKDGENVAMGGIVTEFKRLATRSGSTMGFLKVEDIYGQIEVIVFNLYSVFWR